MIVDITCTYCGHKWDRYIASKGDAEKLKCFKCNDSNLIVRDLKSAKIDYYEGAPAFPASKETADLLDWMS